MLQIQGIGPTSGRARDCGNLQLGQFSKPNKCMKYRTKNLGSFLSKNDSTSGLMLSVTMEICILSITGGFHWLKLIFQYPSIACVPYTNETERQYVGVGPAYGRVEGWPAFG